MNCIAHVLHMQCDNLAYAYTSYTMHNVHTSRSHSHTDTATVTYECICRWMQRRSYLVYLLFSNDEFIINLKFASETTKCTVVWCVCLLIYCISGWRRRSSRRRWCWNKNIDRNEKYKNRFVIMCSPYTVVYSILWAVSTRSYCTSTYLLRWIAL